MRRVLVAALLLSLMPAPAAGAAAQSAQEEQAGADAAEKLISAYYKDFYAKKFDQALADIKDLNPDPSNKEGRAVLDAMRATALLGLKRDAEAQKLIAEVREISPREPIAGSTLFSQGLLVDRFDVAAAAFDEMIARYPDAVRDLDKDVVSYFLLNVPKEEKRRNEDRDIALARIGFGGDTEAGHWLAFEAVKILVRRGDFSGANELVRYAAEPLIFENMLIQKRYSALWRTLESVGGLHLATLRAANVAAAQQDYESTSDDAAKLQAYVQALSHAGRLSDAISLKSKVPSTEKAMAKVDEKTGWLVDSIATALDEAGRLDEADQLYGSLNDPPRDDAGWRISMIINRFGIMATRGRFDRASALLAVTEKSVSSDGSAYAKQAVRALKYCVLSSTGRKAEAESDLPDMLKDADNDRIETVDSLLCAGDPDSAEKLVLAGLSAPDEQKREEFEEKFVRMLQPILLTDDNPSAWQARWTEFRKRPAIAGAYERLGRDMPAEFLPEKRVATAN
jgi:tetratricopeptide (TPR) repeat protein